MPVFIPVIEPLGVLTISTHGRGDLLSGSVKVTSDRPIGGFLRFSLPDIGVDGVGAGHPVPGGPLPRFAARRGESAPRRHSTTWERKQWW